MHSLPADGSAHSAQSSPLSHSQPATPQPWQQAPAQQSPLTAQPPGAPQQVVLIRSSLSVKLCVYVAATLAVECVSIMRFLDSCLHW